MLDRDPMKLLRLLACVLTVCLAAGCGNACRDLAEKICQCIPDEGNRQLCNQRAKEAEKTYVVRPEDEAYCAQQVDKCDCTKLRSSQEQVDCGLAYAPAP